MKNNLYIILLCLFGPTIFGQSSFDNSETTDWNKFFIEDEMIPGCGLQFYYALEENSTKLYFTLADPETGEANNDLYSEIIEKNIKFEIHLDNYNISLPIVQLSIGNWIDPESEIPYLFEYSFIEPIFPNSFTVSLFNVQNCEFPGVYECSNNFRLPFELSDFDNYELIDPSTAVCLPEDEQDLCALNDKVVGFTADNDLHLNVENIATSEVLTLIGNSSYSSIEFKITGINSNSGNSGFALVEFYNSNWPNFNAEDWEEILEDFAIYDEYFIETILHSEDSDFNCENPIELSLLNENETCDVLVGLNYSLTNGDLYFSYTDPGNPNYLEDYLDLIEMSVQDAEAILDQNVNNIIYTLNYSNGGPFVQATYTQTNISSINLVDLEASFSNISAENFVGSLLIEYQNFDGETFECLIDPIDLSPANENPLPDYNCDDDYSVPDITNQEDINSINVGEIIYSAGLAIRITEINSINNSYSGKGEISLPFADNHINVIFNGIKINTEKNVYQGKIFGVEGDPSTYPDFAINPDTLSFGGDICLPSAIDEETDEDGFDNVTGLDANGFGRDSIHSETNTIYDLNGYDISGNHKETGKEWNEEGCTRNGELWAINEETGEMENTNQPCDPSSSNDPIVTEYIDSISTEIPAIVENAVNNLMDAMQDSLSTLNCGAIKSSLETILNTVVSNNPNIDPTYITGESNEFINEGMSSYFSSPPKPSIFQSDQRDQNIVELENEHVKLFTCDKKKTVYADFLKVAQTNSGDALVEHIQNLIQNLTKTQVEDFKRDPAIFQDWIIFQIGKYLDEELGIVYTPINHKETSPMDFQYSNSPYHSTADLDGLFLDNIESKDENYWLFNQGFDDINGVSRAFYLEELHRQMVVGGEDENVLPIKISKYIDASFYDIYLSGVELSPEGASVDAYFVFVDPNSGKKIVFEAQNLSFGTGGIIGESKLSLASAIELRLSNSALLRILPGDNTSVYWDCDGFKGINLEGNIELCENIILPIDPSTDQVIPNERYTIDFYMELESWSEFYFSVNEGDIKPFAMANNPDFIFNASDLVVDFSDTYSAETAVLPEEYLSPHISNLKFLKSWQGFYLGQLTAKMPNMFSSDSENIALSVNHLLIDGSGVSTEVFAENVIDINSGKMKGWPISITDLNLTILRNNIRGGGLGGDLRIPIFENPTAYTASIYSNGNMDFTISPNESNEIDMFLATVTVFDDSFIEVAKVDGEYDAKAVLNGEINVNAETDAISLNIPKIKFKEFEVSTKSPYFSPGTWSFKNDIGVSFAGFAINLKNIVPITKGEGEVGLAFNVDLSLIDSLKINAGGGFEVVGKNILDANEQLDWVYDRTITNSFYVDAEFSGGHVKGDINRFEKHNIYGEGFKGSVEMKFPAIGTVTALGQFGKTNHQSDEDYKYFFVDAMAEIAGLGIPVGPLVIDGFAGGLSYKMFPNYDNIQIGENSNNSNLALGQSMSGAIFNPDPQIGLGFKAGVLLSLAKNKKLFNGSAMLNMYFKESGGLEQIGFEGVAQFMANIELGLMSSSGDKTKAPVGIDAALNAHLNLNYNFTRKEFHGSLEAFLQSPNNILTGAGTNFKMVTSEMHFDSDKWYIHIGTPTDRCGINVSIPSIGTAKFDAYLDVGTVIPDMPPLPPEMSLIRDKFKPNNSLRSSGGGFVFGSSFKMNAGIDFGIGSTELSAGLGFDLMVRDFGDAYCAGNTPSEQIGFNGWYSLGQIYAYITGKVKLFGFNVLEAGLAAALQAQMPNPFFARAGVGVTVNTFLGSFEEVVDISIGEQCFIVTDDPDNIGLEVIASITPYDGTEGLEHDFTPEIIFSIPIDKAIDIADITGETVSYEARINEITIEDSYGNVGFDKEFDGTKTNLKLRPYDLFYSGDSISVTVSIDIFKNDSLVKNETKSTSFYITTEKISKIPSSNIMYSYPIDGMFNFYKKEYIEEEGYITLNSGMPELLLDAPDDFDLKVIILKNNGDQYVYDCEYEVGNRKLSFPLPSQNLENNVAYRLDVTFMRNGTYQPFSTGNSIDLNSNSGGMNTSNFGSINPEGESIISNENESRITLHSLYFRVSDFDDLGSKIYEIKDADTDISYSQLEKYAEIELFDEVDLSLLQLTSDDVNTWFIENYKNTIFKLDPPFQIMGVPECEFEFSTVTASSKMARITNENNSSDQFVINQDRFINGWDEDYTGTRIEFTMPSDIKNQLNEIKSECDICLDYIVNVLFGNGDYDDYDSGEEVFEGEADTKLLEVYNMEYVPLYEGIYKARMRYTLPGNILVREALINFDF